MTTKSFVLAAAFAVITAGAIEAKEEPVRFAADIQPILTSGCPDCHRKGGEGFEKSGLDLSSYDGLMRGTNFGPMVIPGDPLTSNLMVLIDGAADKRLQMPHDKKKLSQQDRDLIRRWIEQGATNN